MQQQRRIIGRIHRRIYVPVAALAAFGSAPLLAQADDLPHQQPAFYIGGGVGYSRIGSENFPTSNEDFNDDRVSWKALAGVRFNPVLSLEGQYIDFGTAKGTFSRVDAHGWTAGAVADIPLPYVQPYAKVGALFWNADYKVDGGGGAFNGSDDGTSLTWGGGARFNLSQNVDLRVEYERFKLNDTHVDNGSVALQFSF